MYKSQKGFTLVELVVVIVLLGILGVTALGKFENLSADAADAANSGVAAEISSAAAINFAANVINGGGVAMDNTNDSCAPADLAPLFQSGTFPAGYTAANPSTDCPTVGTGGTYNCDISDTAGLGTIAVATIICTAP